MATVWRHCCLKLVVSLEVKRYIPRKSPQLNIHEILSACLTSKRCRIVHRRQLAKVHLVAEPWQTMWTMLRRSEEVRRVEQVSTGSFQFFLSTMEVSVFLLCPVGYGALFSLRCIDNRLRKSAIDVEHETLFSFAV